MRVKPIWMAGAGLAAAGALGACSLPVLDKDADAAAKALYDEVRTGAALTTDPHVGAQLNGPDAAPQLAAIRAALPNEAPTTVKSTGFSFNTSTGAGTVETLNYEYDFAGGRVVNVTDVLRKPPGQTTWTITGIKVDPGGGAAPMSAGEPPPPPSNASGS